MKVFSALALAAFSILFCGPAHAAASTPTSFDKDIVCQSGTYQPLIGRLQLASRAQRPEAFTGSFIDNVGVRHPARLNANPAFAQSVLTIGSDLGIFAFNISATTVYTDWSGLVNTKAPASLRLAPAITVSVKNHSTSTMAWTISFTQLQGAPMIFPSARTVTGSITVSFDADGNITSGRLVLPVGPRNEDVDAPVFGGFVSNKQLTTVVKIKGRNFVLNGTSSNSDFNFSQCVAVYGNSKSSIYLLWNALVPAI